MAHVEPALGAAGQGRGRGAWAADRRSVGELLRDADHLARDLLLDVDGDQAPALLRTWGEAVQSAAELWQSLPAPGWAAQGRSDAEVMARLDVHARRMHRSQLRAGWPGDGPTDERLLRIAETFTRAADLVDRYHRQRTTPERRPAVQADVAAARTRTVHALHVASHGVLLAVRQHVADQHRETAGSREHRRTRAVPRGLEAQRRLEVFERLAGAYVERRFVAAARGEHRPPVAGLDRLEAALVRWDVHAHRVLAYGPSPADLALTAATHAYLAAATHAVVSVGATTGSIDPATHERTTLPLEASNAAWTALAGGWRRLADPSTSHTDRDLLTAAGEVRAAVLAITHDATAPASPADVAIRVDVPHAAHHLQQALTAAADLAHELRDTARDQDVLVPARTALTAYFATATSSQDRPAERSDTDPEDLASPVDVAALIVNARVPLPTAVQEGLALAAERTATAAGRAMSATSPLAVRTHPAPDEQPSGPATRRLDEPYVQSVLPLPAPEWAR